MDIYVKGTSFYGEWLQLIANIQKVGMLKRQVT